MRLNYEAEPEDAVQDEHDEFFRRSRKCEDCGRCLPSVGYHDCPALRPERPDR